MKLSTVAQVATLKDPPLPQYHYDLRLEIGVKEVSETIPVVAIFQDLIKRMKAAADGNHLVALTANDNLYLEQKELSSDEFKKAFHVATIEGKINKVMLGFKIRSMTKLSDLKSRLLNTYLKPHNLFLRTHTGGFDNGVKTYAYGYLKHDHPDHPDSSALNQRFARRMSEAWKNLDKEERKKWKDEHPNLFYGTTGITLPIIFTKEKITATSADKEKIMTTALVVSTPAKYGRFAKMLLDMAITNRKINNLIPFALSKEDSDGYYFMLAEQARFIESHRNIPISQVPIDANTFQGIQGQTLQDLLNAHSSISRVSYDPQNNKYHVSTTAVKYKEVHNWIEKLLKEHKFPYGPTIRPLKYLTTTSYAAVFRDAMSVASGTYDSSPQKASNTNAWRTRPPLDISYIPTDAAFPPLPAKKSTLATASTMSETLDEDKIQNAISSAIKKLEDQHNAAITQLKNDFQKKLEAVEGQMQALGEHIAVQTYQALVKEGSPLATKTEQEILRQDVSLIKTQLSTLINMFKKQSKPTPSTESPSTPTEGTLTHTPPSRNTSIPKRTRTNSSPIPMTSLEDVYTQELLGTSATSIPEEDMGGCEY